MFSIVLGASLFAALSGSTMDGFQVLESGDADLSAFCIASVDEEPVFSWDLMEPEAVVRFGNKVRQLDIPKSWGDREELAKDDHGQTFARTTFVMGGFAGTSWAGDGGSIIFEETAPSEEIAREESDSRQIYHMKMTGTFSGQEDTIYVRIDCGL